MATATMDTISMLLETIPNYDLGNIREGQEFSELLSDAAPDLLQLMTEIHKMTMNIPGGDVKWQFFLIKECFFALHQRLQEFDESDKKDTLEIGAILADDLLKKHQGFPDDYVVV